MSSVTESVALALVLGLEDPVTSLVMAQGNETVVLHLVQVLVDPVMSSAMDPVTTMERQVSVPVLAGLATGLNLMTVPARMKVALKPVLESLAPTTSSVMAQGNETVMLHLARVSVKSSGMGQVMTTKCQVLVPMSVGFVTGSSFATVSETMMVSLVLVPGLEVVG